MSRGWLVVGVVVAVTAVRLAGADSCIDVAQGYQRQDAAAATNDARFKKAIADKKLKPVALAHMALLARQVGDTIAGDFKVDRAETAERNGAKVQVVTAIEGSCGYSTPTDFVQQGSKIYRAERKPKHGTTTKVETCGCAYPRGGCGQRMVAHAVGYVLPDGTSWGGILPIEYVEDTVDLTHASPCPPPQPLP